MYGILITRTDKWRQTSNFLRSLTGAYLEWPLASQARLFADNVYGHTGTEYNICELLPESLPGTYKTEPGEIREDYIGDRFAGMAELQQGMLRNTYRHVKSGGAYKVVLLGLQEKTLEDMVVYYKLPFSEPDAVRRFLKPIIYLDLLAASPECGATQVWIRPLSEFLDGRFELYDGND